MRAKKNVLSVLNGSLETYTRYSRVADDEQKKRVFLSNLFEGGHSFSNFFKVGYLKKNGKP